MSVGEEVVSLRSNSTSFGREKTADRTAVTFKTFIGLTTRSNEDTCSPRKRDKYGNLVTGSEKAS